MDSPTPVVFLSTLPIRHAWFPVYAEHIEPTQKEAVLERMLASPIDGVLGYRLPRTFLVETDLYLEKPNIGLGLDPRPIAFGR